jgi:phosphatidylglycerol lysyltransferase
MEKRAFPMLRALLPRPATPDPLRAAARRLPFTLSVVLAILVVTVLTNTIARPITPRTLSDWGFSLDDLRHGRLYFLLPAPFQAYRPYMVLTITSSVLLFVGACEYLLGTRRAIITFWVTHIAAYIGTFLLLWPFATAGYQWADHLAGSPDVGASAAGFGSAGAVIPFLPPSYRKPAFTGLWIYLLAYLVVDRRVWDIEHLIALAAGLALGFLFLRERGERMPALVGRPRFSRWQRPTIIAWAVGVMGFVNVLSAFLAPRHRTLAEIERQLPFAVVHASRHLTLVLGFALLVLALGLARGKRQAWLLTAAALAASAALHIVKGGNLPEALLALGLLIVLIAWRDEFVARPDPPSLWQGVRALALLAVFLPLYGIAGFFLLRYHFAEVHTVWAAVRETAERLVFADAGEYLPQTRRARWFLDSIPVVGWSGLLYALVLLLRGALAPRRTAPDLEQARQLLSAYGRGGTSYMTLWDGNCIFFGPDRACYIGYRYAAGVALALGDPIGPDAAIAPTIEAFARFCREQGWGHAFYAAAPHVLGQYEQLGYRVLKVGEEATIPLPGLEFKGREWQDIRTAINRAAREGVAFRLYDGGSVPAEIRAQLFAISDEWLAAKDLPSMGFTLGTVADVDDPNVQVAVAIDREGRVQGFLDWLPMYAARGWVIDLMRRRSDAFPGVMEFLIGSSLLAFKEQGYQVASLAAAPLADQERGDGPPLQRALRVVFDHFDTFYNFQTLFAFKKKFQPRWQGVYLVYRSHGELPRIAVAILRAHMPELGPRLVAEIVGGGVVERLVGSRAGEPAAPVAGRAR